MTWVDHSWQLAFIQLLPSFRSANRCKIADKILRSFAFICICYSWYFSSNYPGDWNFLNHLSLFLCKDSSLSFRNIQWQITSKSSKGTGESGISRNSLCDILVSLRVFFWSGCPLQMGLVFSALIRTVGLLYLATTIWPGGFAYLLFVTTLTIYSCD